MASYVRHTSANLPNTRFSHRPLKFFFLILAVLPYGNILPIPQKQSPKTKSSSFWGINTDGFGRCHRQKALIHRRFKSDAKSPKTPSRNITMSWGNIDFSRKGKVVCSVGLRLRLPPALVILNKMSLKSGIYARLRIVRRTKTRPCTIRCKVLFFYVGVNTDCLSEKNLYYPTTTTYALNGGT